MRLCERCKACVSDGWDYAWCEECGKNGVCHHGKPPHECNDCMIASDLAYDSARENRQVVRRDDDPPANPLDK